MLLKMENVKKSYGSFNLDCSLVVPKGSVIGLIGQNGAGKSTAFRAALALIRKDGGNVEILGKQADKLTVKDKEQIGTVLSEAGFSGYLTVSNIIPVMASLYKEFGKEVFLKQCERFSVPLNKKFKDFSTGMKAKLKVLLAMSHNARLLILDEPTSGLDVLTRNDILDLLREYMETEGRGILISSHISTDLEGLCDELYMIDEGKIILHEETDVLLDNYGILKMTDAQYEALDHRYLLKEKKEHYGYCCLTDQKRYYAENYPSITVEKGSIDDLIMMMIRGEAI